MMAMLYPSWSRFGKYLIIPAGKDWKKFLDAEVENLRRWKEIVCSDEIAEKLKKMKSATIDRRLSHEKEVLKLKEKYRQKSSFLLSNVSTKTSADFDRNIVGNEQVDFVESCGASAAGEYVNNLSICDIFSSWWEGEAVMEKGQQRALLTLDKIRKRMPYRRLIESDQISKEEKEALTAIYHSLNPAELKRIIDKKLNNLYEIHKKKKGQENIKITNKLIPFMSSSSTMVQKDNFGVMVK